VCPRAFQRQLQQRAVVQSELDLNNRAEGGVEEGVHLLHRRIGREARDLSHGGRGHSRAGREVGATGGRTGQKGFESGMLARLDSVVLNARRFSPVRFRPGRLRPPQEPDPHLASQAREKAQQEGDTSVWTRSPLGSAGK
jgi:hypothetical protein